MSPLIFQESEPYSIVTTSANPLNNNTKSCYQGLQYTSIITCNTTVTSYKVCGNMGFFYFSNPVYIVNEDVGYLRLNVLRSGGGYGNVSVSYYLKHLSTSDADVSATAMYTTSQVLDFSEGELCECYEDVDV